MKLPKSLEIKRDKHIENSDNESGSFLSKDLIKIRKTAYTAGALEVLEQAEKLALALSMIREFSKVSNDRCGHQQYANKALAEFKAWKGE